MSPADRQFALYAIGRPLMVVIWGIALWGTVVAARLAWILVTAGSAEAFRFLWFPSVSVPLCLAVLMWTAGFAAFGRFRKDREQAVPGDEE